MKVCFFLGGLTGNGGIGRVTSVTANALAASKKVDVAVLSFADTKKPPLYRLDPAVSHSFLFPSSLSMKKAFLKNIVGKLASFLKSNEIDVLIACGSLYFPPAVLACKKARKKCICWEHTAPVVTTDHAFQAWSRKFGAKKSNANVLLTKATKRYYDTHFCSNQKNFVIYNPIDPQALQLSGEYDPGSHKIISIGRLNYHKNHELMIRVAKEVLPNHPDWSWDVYGDGELKELLLSQLRGSAIESQFHLKGQVSDLYHRYQSYAFIVLTSRHEGFPMTLLEAAAYGLPMISFDIETGPNEIIENEKNGFLLPQENEVAMVAAIEALISNQNLRTEMAKHSKEQSTRFSLETTISDWLTLFEKIK